MHVKLGPVRARITVDVETAGRHLPSDASDFMVDFLRTQLGGGVRCSGAYRELRIEKIPLGRAVELAGALLTIANEKSLLGDPPRSPGWVGFGNESDER